MGNLQFKACCTSKSSALSSIIPTSTTETQRENMATWYRVNIAVTDVYEIIKTIGQGRMGEVYHVRRKDGGRTHTEETKRKESEKSLHSTMSNNSAAGDTTSNNNNNMDDTSSRGSRGSRGSWTSGSILNLGGSASKARRNRRNQQQQQRDPLDESMGSLTGIIIANLEESSSKDSPHTKQKKTMMKRLRKGGGGDSVDDQFVMRRNFSGSHETPPPKTNDTSSQHSITNIQIPTHVQQGRKEPPNLAKTAQPKGILKKKPKHGSSPNLLALAENDNGGGDANYSKPTGMTALITGKSIDDDDDDDSDESVPMNPDAISQDPNPKNKLNAIKKTKSTDDQTSCSDAMGTMKSLANQTTNAMKKVADQTTDAMKKMVTTTATTANAMVSATPTKKNTTTHASFQEDDEEISSVVSDVTLNEEDDDDDQANTPTKRDEGQSRDSIVTGDDPKDKDEKKKKWVPRRRVFFRRHYACKTIATEKIAKGQMEELLNEIYMMRKMDHPYIIRLYEVYQVEQKIWLVMDHCTGGNLGSRRLDEQQITVVAEQILRGVAYLHRRGICHRDLKMENILYENNKANSSIRLIDFGLSLTYDRIGARSKFTGAAYTLSPEVLMRKPYTEKSDVWSIGILIWILLAGDYPFIRRYEDLKSDRLKKKLENAAYQFGITWRGRGLTQYAREFVQGCLRKDPHDRWSALQALEYMQDTWIPKLEEKIEKDAEAEARIFPQKKEKQPKCGAMVKYTKERLPPPKTISASRRKRGSMLIDKNVLDDIKRFAQYSLFKKTILVTLANTMDGKDVGEARELFLMIDRDQSGTITLPELKAVLSKADSNEISDATIETIFEAIDYDGSGEVHYAEFLAAFAESQGLITYDRLEDSFDRIDRTGKGFISHDDLKHILGENYTKEIVDSMIEEGDFKKNGQVDFEEFVQLMMGGESDQMNS